MTTQTVTNGATKPKQQSLSTIPLNNMELAAATASNEQEVVSSDVLIPRLLLMQGISPFVTGRKAQIGQMVKSTTMEVLGDPEHPVDIVPLRMVSTWTNFEEVQGAGKPQFRGQEPRGKIVVNDVVTSNEGLPWKYKGPNGEDMLRKKTVTLYALVPSDVSSYEKEIDRAVKAGEAPDLNKTVLPVVLTFQSTSFKHAGKKCASFFNNVRVNAQKLHGKMVIAPFQYILPLSCKEEKKGDQLWYVYDFGAPKPLKDMQVRETAATWAMVINKGSVKVDDTGEVAEEDTSSNTVEMEV